MILGNADAVTWLDVVKQGGPVAALLGVILFGGFKEKPWWVFGWVFRDLAMRHERLRSEKDDWRDMALAGTHIANTFAQREEERKKL